MGVTDLNAPPTTKQGDVTDRTQVRQGTESRLPVAASEVDTVQSDDVQVRIESQIS
jgi:hypothetical protein